MASVRKRSWCTSKGEPREAWVVAYTHKGKQRLKTFQSKRDAIAWRAEMQVEVKRGTHTPASTSPTVAEAGNSWVEQAAVDGLERATVALYRQRLTHHIVPYLGSVKLAALTPADITDYRNAMIRDGRSANLAAKVVGSLGSILAHAMEDGRVSRNVVHERSKRRARRVEQRHDARLEVGVDIPTKDELQAILAAAEATPWRPLIVTALFTGLRSSELRGLRWSDVDLGKGTLTVRQRADRYQEIGSPKSRTSQRTIPLAPMVVNALREWKLACPFSTLDLVFPTPDGHVQQHSSQHRGLGSVLVSAGIGEDPRAPKYGMHSLRHACASLWIEQGFGPKRVQALMGHSSITMTFDRYGHLFPNEADDAEAMRQVQARLVGSPTVQH